MRRLVFAFCLFATSASAEDIISEHITVQEIGITCGAHTDHRQEAPGTVTGDIWLLDETPKIISTSREVPALPGLSFGIIYDLNWPGVISVTNIVTHPEFPGYGVTEQKWTSTYTPSTGHFRFYQLDYDYELQPGTWVLESIGPDGTLYRLEWEVVPATPDNPIVQLCSVSDLLS